MNGPPMPFGTISVMKTFRKLAKGSTEKGSTKSRIPSGLDQEPSKDIDWNQDNSKTSPMQTLKEALEDAARETQLAGMLAPNPCFRPLEHKLAPRDELRVRPPRGSQSSDSVVSPSTNTYRPSHASDSFSGSTTLEVCQEQPKRSDASIYSRRKPSTDQLTFGNPRRQQSMSDLEKRASTQKSYMSDRYGSRDSQTQHVGDYAIQNKQHRRQKSAISSASKKKTPRLTSVRDKRLTLHPTSVANHLGKDDKTKVEAWCKYLLHYSKGEYNMCNPPAPDILDSKFDYLPAVFPHDEIKRMSTYQLYEVLWDNYGAEAANPLVREAAEFFGVDFAMISFFDESRELCKVQWGLDSDGIFGRPISIAAHSLYTMDVMVVPNTKLDWRFKNNPWVLQWPQVRFFAIAPLMANDHVIGAFTILDRLPHAAFSYSDRRKLVEFSDRTMAGMHKQYAWNTREEIRMTPLLERDSRVYGDYEPQGITLFKRRSVQMIVTKRLSHVSIEPYVKGAEQTPPSSSEDNKVFGEVSSRKRKVSSKQHKLPLILTPDSRDFSTSDLTSLHENPAPTLTLRGSRQGRSVGGEDTVENFLDLTDHDFFEPSLVEPEKFDHHHRAVKPGNQEESHSDRHSEYERCSSHGQKASSEEASYQDEDSFKLRHKRAQGEYANGEDDETEHLLHREDAGEDYKEEDDTDDLTKLYDSFPSIGHPPCPGPPPSIPPPPLPRESRQSSYQDNTSQSRTRPHDSTRSLRKQPSSSTIFSLRSSFSTSTVPSSQTNPSKSNSYFATVTAKCANISQLLNYDLVYLVELKAVRTHYKDDSELLLDRQLRTKVLARYPLGDTSSLTVSVDHHLEALRKTISIFLGRERGRRRPEESAALKGYEFGVLISLDTPGPSLLRTNGVVLGAFRHVRATPPLRSSSKKISQSMAQKNEEESEVQKLREAVAREDLEGLLARENARKKSIRGEKKLRERRSIVEKVTDGTKHDTAQGERKASQEGRSNNTETYIPDVIERKSVLARYPPGKETPITTDLEK